MGCGASSVQTVREPHENNPVPAPIDEALNVAQDEVVADDEDQKNTALVTSLNITLECFYRIDSLDSNYDSAAHIEIPLYNYLRHAFPHAELKFDFVRLQEHDYRIRLNALNGVHYEYHLIDEDCPISLESYDKHFVYDVGHTIRKIARQCHPSGWEPKRKPATLHRLFAQTIACTLLEDVCFEQDQQVPLLSNESDNVSVVKKKQSSKSKSKKEEASSSKNKDIMVDGKYFGVSKRDRILYLLRDAGFKINDKDDFKTTTHVARALENIWDAVVYYTEVAEEDDAVPVEDTAVEKSKSEKADVEDDVEDEHKQIPEGVEEAQREHDDDEHIPLPRKSHKHASPASTCIFPVADQSFNVLKSCIPLPEAQKALLKERGTVQDYLVNQTVKEVIPARSQDVSVLTNLTQAGVVTDDDNNTYTLMNPLSYDFANLNRGVVCSIEEQVDFSSVIPTQFSVPISSHSGFDIFQHLGIRPLYVATNEVSQPYLYVLPTYTATMSDLLALYFMFIVCVSSAFPVPTLQGMLYGDSNLDTLCLHDLFMHVSNNKARISHAQLQKLGESKLVKDTAVEMTFRQITNRAQADHRGISFDTFHLLWKEITERVDVRQWGDEDFGVVGLKKEDAGRLMLAGWSRTAIKFATWAYHLLDFNRSGMVEESDYDVVAEMKAFNTIDEIFNTKQSVCSFWVKYPFPTSKLLHIDQDRKITLDSWMYFVGVVCQGRPEHIVNLVRSLLHMFSINQYCNTERNVVLRNRNERVIVLFNMILHGHITSAGLNTSEDLEPLSNLVTISAEDYIVADNIPAVIINSSIFTNEISKHILKRRNYDLRVSHREREDQAEKDAVERGEDPSTVTKHELVQLAELGKEDKDEKGRMKIRLLDFQHAMRLSGVLQEQGKGIEKYWYNIGQKFKL